MNSNSPGIIDNLRKLSNLSHNVKFFSPVDHKISQSDNPTSKEKTFAQNPLTAKVLSAADILNKKENIQLYDQQNKGADGNGYPGAFPTPQHDSTDRQKANQPRHESMTVELQIVYGD